MTKEGGDPRPPSPSNANGSEAPPPQQFTPVNNTANSQRPPSDNSTTNGHAPPTSLAPIRSTTSIFGGPVAPVRTSTPAPPPPSMAYAAGGSSNGGASITTSPHRQSHSAITSQPPITPSNGNGYSHHHIRQQSLTPPLPGPPPTDDAWQSVGDSDSGGHKRKRSMSPVTQTQHHHLAAHEAAMGPLPMPELPLHRIDSGLTGSDDGSVRGMSIEDSSPHPQGLQVDPHTGVRVDPKRRKRVFSNRTKTGCITCRRRKKKCDEGKPECTNCKRGGFVCEGYSGKVSWQKPPGKQLPSTAANGPPYIQSKEDQPGALPISLSVGTPTSTTHHHGMDDRPYRTPNEQHSAISAPMQDTMSPQNTHSYLPLRGEPTPTAAPATPTAQNETFGATPTASGPERRLSFSQQPLNQSTVAMAQQKSEKERMLSAQLYHANTPELMAEREACKIACWRYNSIAGNPSLGLSQAEKGKMLLDILRPGNRWEVVNTGAAPGTPGALTYMSDNGFTSDIIDVQVEAPFNCSYGYNISLGRNVSIEFGCTILDCNKVTIKARTILSPGVSIYSATHPIDFKKRNSVQGAEIAKAVTIEEDCWLGGNVIVLGGITIGKGSVIGAGSVVTRDVPPFTVVAGNPARVIRGIYHNGAEM